jgi:Kinesin motor domain
VQRFSKSVVPQGKRVKDQTFAFDRVFDENTTQSDVYEATTRNLLDSVLDGYNATVFAYGATGCGKTHTITGTAQQPGIIFLTMQELFERIQDLKEEKVIEISLSYLEIYNETIRDLLVPGGSKHCLMLREDAHQAVSVAGLSSHHPQNVRLHADFPINDADVEQRFKKSWTLLYEATNIEPCLPRKQTPLLHDHTQCYKSMSRRKIVTLTSANLIPWPP